MKLKFTSIPFFISLIIILSFRIYQFFYIGNSMVRMNWDNIELICVSIALITSIIIIIMSFIAKDIPKVFVISKSIFMSCISSLVGLIVIINSFSQIAKFFSDDHDIIVLCISVFGILAGVIFIMLMLCSYQGKNLFEKCRLLTLLPTIWALFKLIYIFFKYNSIPTDISHISSSLDVICMLFFFFYQARLFAGLFNKATFRKIYYFGFASVLFTALHSTYDIIHTIDQGQKFTTSVILSTIMDICLVLYIISFVLSMQIDTNLEFSETHETTDLQESFNNDKVDEDIIEESTFGGFNNGIDKEEMSEINALIEDIQNEKA